VVLPKKLGLKAEAVTIVCHHSELWCSDAHWRPPVFHTNLPQGSVRIAEDAGVMSGWKVHIRSECVALDFKNVDIRLINFNWIFMATSSDEVILPSQSQSQCTLFAI